MSDPLNQFSAVLKASGQSLTASRTAVFMAFQDGEPQTIHELTLSCQPKVDRASVYRTVKLFEQLGIIQRLQIGWKYKLELSSAFQHHHHHMICRSCGEIIDIPEDSDLENRLASIAAKHHFTIQEHQLEVQGRCARCQPGLSS